MRGAIVSIVLLAMLGAGLHGCNPVYVRGVELGEFDRLVVRIKDELGCAWYSKAQAYDTANYDFGCHADKWATVSLLLNKDDETGKVDRIRLLWEEREPGSHFTREALAAHKFVDFLAETYIPSKHRLLSNTFFGEQGITFSTSHLVFRYRYFVETNFKLHKLEIAPHGKVYCDHRSGCEAAEISDIDDIDGGFPVE